jgi:molybdate transport system substrate-binding protein
MVDGLPLSCANVILLPKGLNMRLHRCLATLLFLVASVWAPAAEEGIVAASAGIAPCVEALIKSFATQGGQPLSLVREATGTIARQMDQGAPYDVLVAADPEWPEWLTKRGKLREAAVCAQGRMVVWVTTGEAPQLEELGKLILACPDPETTSHGKLAQRFLQDRKLWDAGKQSGKILVVANAVQGVLTVKGGAAQAALIPLALAQNSNGASRELPGTEIPTVAGLATTSTNPNARAFLKFLTSPAAAPVWRQWGFEILSKP